MRARKTSDKLMSLTDCDPKVEYDTFRNMLSWRRAGLIVTGRDQPPETRQLLTNAGVPVVQIMDTDGNPVDAYVGFSHTEAGYDIATSLLETGLTRVGCAGRNLGKGLMAAKRKQGFQSALRDHALAFADTIDGSDLGAMWP